MGRSDGFIGSNPGGNIPAFDKGGMVKKTEKAIVHKGERVLTKSDNRKLLKIFRSKEK